MNEKLFEAWPPWVERPLGIVFRIAGALGSLAFGGLLVFFGYFGASFKKTPAVWGTEEILMVVAGVMVATAGVAWAIRPSRFTMGAALAALLAVYVMGAVI